MEPFQHLKAVVFDWAGTMIDHGSRAPAIVFQEIFRQQGITITIDQAREPMGMAKRDHIATVSQMPSVKEQWVERYGAECSDDDVEKMYQQFLPLQKETLKNHSQLIDGAAAMAASCRAAGLKLGSTTGYTRELMVEVKAAAKAQGYEPDSVLCAEDAPQGRPAPFLLYQTAIELQVFPMHHLVKVDDTVMGIEAGVHAGCWNIGVSRTGNLLGLSAEEVDQMPDEERRSKLEAINQKLFDAGAHLVVESVDELEPALRQIDSAIQQGSMPGRLDSLV